MSEYFTRFITNKEKFDFNDFETREEFDAFIEEVQLFIKENETD